MAQIGLKNIYYAVMESDTATETTYKTPVKLGEAISVDMNPTVNRNQLYGDDMAIATHAGVGEITVTIETTDMPLKDKAALLGHTFESDTLIASSTDTAPYVALLFESETHDGKNRCVKLLKGKFAPTQETINTRGDSLDYQPPSLEAVFVARKSDGEWKFEKELAKGVSTATWYTSV